MKTKKQGQKFRTWQQKYPPSEPCSCEICVDYCNRPGWWTVDEARKAIKAGLAHRMMLEISPEITFCVLSPAFKKNEAKIAMQINSGNRCTFIENEKCSLFGSGLQPLECRYCHHDRQGLGKKCHADLENDWNTPNGKNLVKEWAIRHNLLDYLKNLKIF